MLDEAPVQTGIPAYTDPALRPRFSNSISKLAAALAKAQGEMENAEKDQKGNYGKYATLASTWDAIRKPLSKNEIAIYQRPLNIRGKLIMCTMMIHSSGEFIDDSELELVFNKDGRLDPMQAMGSAVTYARRYTLQAAIGIAPADDDDGQGAGKPKVAPSGPPPAKKESKPPQEPKPKPAAGGNFAPASEAMMERINDLCREKHIAESILRKLICEGYGEIMGSVKTWVAMEIGHLLAEDGTSEATLMAKTQRLISEREAKRLVDGGKQ